MTESVRTPEPRVQGQGICLLRQDQQPRKICDFFFLREREMRQHVKGRVAQLPHTASNRSAKSGGWPSWPSGPLRPRGHQILSERPPTRHCNHPGPSSPRGTPQLRGASRAFALAKLVMNSTDSPLHLPPVSIATTIKWHRSLANSS